MAENVVEPSAQRLTAEEAAEVSARLETASTEDIIVWALERFAPRVALSTAFGPSGLVLVHLAQQLRRDVPVFTIDTGFLFEETLAQLRTLVDRFGVNLQVYRPQLTVDEQAQAHGPELYKRDPDQCCAMRKVEPMQRALAGLDAWVTGLRRSQGATREQIGIVELHNLPDGRALGKVNPMARWTRTEVWNYILKHDLPYNPLHDQGYPSIGCWPCTSAVANEADERAGRWAGQQKTECGIHTFTQLRAGRTSGDA